jgi:hypothetical protein
VLPRRARRPARSHSWTIGKSEITMMATITTWKLRLTAGICPKEWPATRKQSTQVSAPVTFQVTKWRYDMRPIPATKGAKVRTIGTKRARKIVLPPCRA